MPTDLPDDEIDRETQRIGRRIREVREYRNLTQERVILAVPMNRAHYQDIEAGRANPTLRLLLRIAHAIGVPIAALVQDGPPPKGDGDGPSAPRPARPA